MHLKMTKNKLLIPLKISVSDFVRMSQTELPGLGAIFGPSAPGAMIRCSLVIDNDLDDLAPLDRLNFLNIQ